MYTGNTKPTITSGTGPSNHIDLVYKVPGYGISIGKIPNAIDIPSGTLLYFNIDNVDATVPVYRASGTIEIARINTAKACTAQLYLRG